MKSKKLISVICALAMLCTILVVPSYAAQGSMTTATTLDTVPTGADVDKYAPVSNQNISVTAGRTGWNNGAKTPQLTNTGDYILNFDLTALRYSATFANGLALHLNGTWIMFRFQNGDIVVKAGAHNVNPYNSAGLPDNTTINNASDATRYPYSSFDLASANGQISQSKVWSVHVKKTGTSLDVAIREKIDAAGAENTSAAWHKIPTITVTANSLINLQAFCYNNPGGYNIVNEAFYLAYPQFTAAAISAVQPTKAGATIDITLTPSFVPPAAGTDAPVITGGAVAVTGGSLTAEPFTAVGSVVSGGSGNRKLTLTIPVDLTRSTTYTVDLSNVTVLGRALTNSSVTFTTNNGEVEDAYAALNAKTTSAADVTAAVTVLEGFNTFVQNPTYDVFADAFIAGTTANKEALAKKIIENKPVGGYKEFDYSDLDAAVTAAVLEIKIGSYDGVGDEADPLSIFADPIYTDNTTKNTAGAYIKELVAVEGCETLGELTALEVKARSIIALSAAANADAYITIIEDPSYDFAGIIDTTNEDWINADATDKTAIGTYAKAFKPLTTSNQYVNIEEVGKVFNKSLGLVELKKLDNVARGDIAAVLDKYASDMGLDLTLYNEAGADLVNLEIYDELDEIPADNTAVTFLQDKLNTKALVIIDNTDPIVPPTIQDNPTLITPILPVVTPPAVNTNEFTDLAGYDWAKNAIKVLQARGVITGVTETTYEPGRAVNRAELATLIVKAFKLSIATGEDFKDVNYGDWFYNNVNIAYSMGIVSGSNGNFRPYDSITRQDMAVMINNALSKYAIGEADAAVFADADNISDYAVASVNRLAKARVISGSNGYFNPLNSLTRAEAAVVIYQALVAANVL